MSIEVPDLVRQRALSNGAAGAAWLDQLPTLVAGLAEEWDLAVGKGFRGGTAAYVAAAVDGAGAPCVLKVAMLLDVDQLDSFRHSVIAHELADGRGCAKLLRHDGDAPAMLLERLGPNLDELGFQVPQILDTITKTLLSFWRPVPLDVPLPTAPEKAAWLADFIVSEWSSQGQPCARAVIDQALDYCAERSTAFDRASAVLVHGDAHGWNTLDAGGGQFKLVDPEGRASEQAHDLAVPMREYNEPLLDGDTPLLVRRRAEQLATRCDVDPEPIWQWGYVERVSTGLANLRDFSDESGPMFIEVAERCVGA